MSGTVTVDTLDHGSVNVPEPDWCLGVHEAGGFRADIQHDGPEFPMAFATVCHGVVEALPAALMHRPYRDKGSTRPVVTVDIGGEWHEFDAETLAEFIDGLIIYALGTLRPLARKLRALEGEVPR